MILANVRDSLDRDDAQLALRLLSATSGEEQRDAEVRLREGGIDALLDDSRLLAALLSHGLGAHASLPLFCYVVVRHALRRVGENDRALADYVAGIMLHFGLRDTATRISPTDDEQYSTLVDIIASLDQADVRRDFLVRAHLGNYALWMSGLFPDLIEHRRWRRGAPPIDYYEDMGRRGFQLAAEHRMAREHGMDEIYHNAAERFGALRVALNSVSDALLFPHSHSPERLMRQVRDETHWKC